jgi:hypothetical protein
MRSNNVSANTVVYPTDYNTLIDDAAGSGRLLAHQMLGYFTLSTNPANGKTLTLDINGTNVVITFVTSIGSTAGNVLIGASAAATCANLMGLLFNPTITSATQVAIGLNTAANVTLINYLGYSLTGTTLVISSMNTLVSAPLTSFSGSTNATSDSYTAQTLALYVEPGVVFINGTEVYFAGGITPTVTAPTGGNNRIDVLTIDNTGTLAWTTGTAASSPSTPTYPANKLPICELYNVTGETALYDNANQQSGAGYIYNDVRPFLAYPIPIGAIPDNVLPATDATYNLGSASFRWQNIYVSGSVFVNGLALAGKFGGTGASGSLSITSGTTTTTAANAAYLKLEYTSLSITGTGALAFNNPHTNGTIIAIKVQGNVTLTSSATPMLSTVGMGAAGSTNGTTGAGSAGKQPNSNFYVSTTLAGSGGAPYSSGNGAGGNGGTDQPTLINTDIIGKFVPLICGAGGGSGGGGGGGGQNGGNGGNGGGALYIECGGAFNFTTTSGISVAGSAGTAGGSGSLEYGGGGGGGGGGMLVILYASLTANSGTVTVSGGSAGSAGGSGGGGGGGGGASLANSGSGGSSGGGAGGAGGNGTSLIEANEDFS